MKKVIILLVMIFTIIQTIPTIHLNKRQEHASSVYTPKAPSKPLLDDKINLVNESTGNITNQGLAIMDGGQIYYSDGTNLCFQDKEGIRGIQLIEDVYPTNIQVLEDEIYYINNETSEIYKVNKDGSNRQQVSDNKAYSLNIYKDKLYFLDRYNELYITAMSLNGENKEVIKEVAANDMMIYKDYIYYLTREGKLSKIRIDGGDLQLLAKGVMQFDVASSGVYYIYDPRLEHKERGLFRLDFSNNKTQLIEETPYSFNVNGNLVYYNHPTKMSLHKMLMDGSEKREITGANSSDINIAGSYIYYRNLEDGKKIYRITQNGKGRTSLEGKTAVTNVTDLTRELDTLNRKEITPKLERAYDRGRDIIEEIIQAHMADYEKVKVIHDYIVNNTRYDVETAERFLRGEDSDANAFTAYGVFVNNKAVCQGYAEATHILLSLAGVPAELVIGYVDDGEGGYVSHMWNMVFIHNKCYMIDTTWDDPVGPEDVLIYDYFLVDGKTLKEDHYWAYDEYPACN